VVSFGAGQATIASNLAVFQLRTASFELWELYVRGTDRQLCLWSPAGALRSTSINLCSGVVLPNDGTARRVEVSAQANGSVVVRIDGIDRITQTGLTGGTSAPVQIVRAGIDHFDGSAVLPVTVRHGNVAISTTDWVGP
jgi:hypothetical protein